MMSQPARRVRKLHLTAPDQASVRRGALLLEDALNTASLPGTDRGRLIIIRRFSVGKIHSAQSPASIALAIERRLFQLGSAAVHAEEASADLQSIVYFRDDAEPYIRLAVKLAERQNTDAWFWPLAVPCWRRNMPPDEAFRNLLFGVIQTSAGAAAAAAMLGELQKANAVERLISSLRPQDGARLLQAFGWSDRRSNAQIIEYSRNKGPAFSNGWNDVIARWINRWGTDDTRLVWLAAIALVTENPCRLLNPRLIEQAQHAIIMSAPRWSQSSPVSKKPENGEQVITEPVRNLLAQPAEPDEACEAQIPHPAAAEPSLVSVPDKPLESQESKPQAQSSDNEPRDIKSDSRLPSDAAQMSSNAGFYFLIKVMSRLGIAEMLETNPFLIELNFPERLLQRAGNRLGIDASDAVLSLLKSEPIEADHSHFDFIAPARWLEGLSANGPLIIRRAKDAARVRILFDGSGRLALAMWKGKAPAGVRAMIGSSRLKRGPVAARENGLDLLIAAWLTAMRRFCRRYVRIGLADLVRRSGRISATRTHIDIFFKLGQADIRVRKAGLDTNPGWTNWLGRVIQFHYLHAEATNGN